MKWKAIKSLGEVSPGAWARLACLAAALINAALSMLGKSPVTLPGNADEIISIVFAVAASLAAYWKNNSFTRAAQAADEVLEQLRKEGY